MHDGVELTAYLVNESRARCPDLARDPLAAVWIPEVERARIRDLWGEFATAVYPYDDLVVSLRCRCILDTLARTLRRSPDTVLVVCGAGFTSYPWLLPVPAAVEADLPDIVEAKQRRVAELTRAGTLAERPVEHLPVDLASPTAREQLVERVRTVAAGRPVAYVAEGLVFYLPGEAARAVAALGTWMAADPVSVVSYWPTGAAGNQVLAAQRRWFRQRSVPEDATYLAPDELAGLVGAPVDDRSPEDLQQRYLGVVTVAETELIPEHVAVAGA